MIQRSTHLGATVAFLILLGLVLSPWAGSQPEEEWLHGDQCSQDGPVICGDSRPAQGS